MNTAALAATSPWASAAMRTVGGADEPIKDVIDNHVGDVACGVSDTREIRNNAIGGVRELD